MKSFVLIMLFITLIYTEKTSIDYVKEGDDAFVQKDYDAALSAYTMSLNLDSSYYRAYYKRATVYYAVQNYAKAKYDLNYVVINKPNYHLAYELLAKIQLDLADLDTARETLMKAKELKPKNAPRYDRDIERIDVLTVSIKEGNAYFEKKDYANAIEVFSKIIVSLPGAVDLRIKRAQCYYHDKRYSEVLEDTLRILKINKKNPEAIYLRGKAFVYSDQVETGLNHFVQCLKVDSFNQKCKEAHDGLVEYNQNFQEAEDFIRKGRPDQALEKLQTCLVFDDDWTSSKPQIYIKMCQAYINKKDANKAIEYCKKVNEFGETTEALKFLGEAYILKEEYEEAIRWYQKAVDAGDRSAHDGLHNAKKLDKMSKRKDHYKILGVDKSASPRDIKQAFRKLAMQYHPDKVKTTDEAEKERISKMYLDINEAYEVLSNPEKKDRFDRGEDLEENHFSGGQRNFNFGNFGSFFKFN